MTPFPLMIDSGAYSAFTKGKVIDLGDYIAFCHEILEDHPQAVCVNLDVIGNAKASYKNWKIMRKAGVESLPVWHVAGDPTHKYLKKYLKKTDTLGLGAIANMSSSRRTLALDRVWQEYLTNREGMPTAKIHGMGITSFPLVRRYPWYSVDSTSWIKIAMFGHVLQPKRRGGGWDFSAMPTKIGFSTRCSDRKHKAKHYENLSIHERVALLEYLGDKEMLYGTSEIELCEKGVKKGEMVEKIIVPGVSNHFGSRANLCLEFFAEFLMTFPWPRQFRINRPKGFRLVEWIEGLIAAEGELDHTILYLSGSAYRGEDYIKQHRHRMPHVGVLLSYADLKVRGVTWRRLVDLKEIA